MHTCIISSCDMDTDDGIFRKSAVKKAKFTQN